MVNKLTLILISIFFITLNNFVEKANSFSFGGMCGNSCGGGGGGGGGVGGCGGGCGGCGRKKRSILESQLKTELTDICPQSEWKKIINENLNNLDVTSTEFAIYSSMHKEFDGPKLFVNCNLLTNKIENYEKNQTLQQSDKIIPNFIKFISNGEAYCSHGNDKLWCTVIALLG